MTEHITDMYEQLVINYPAVDQKTRADHIVWLRSLARSCPRGPQRRDARRRRRSIIRDYNREFRAQRSVWKDVRIAIMTAPFGVAAGSLLFWVSNR